MYITEEFESNHISLQSIYHLFHKSEQMFQQTKCSLNGFIKTLLGNLVTSDCYLYVLTVSVSLIPTVSSNALETQGSVTYMNVM